MTPRRSLPTCAALGWVFMAVSASLFTACGGGGGGGGVSPPPPGQPLSIVTQSLPEGSLGQSYQFSLGVAGGSPPVSWSLASASDPLPPGLGIDSVGNIDGTPSSTGSFSFTVQVRDSKGKTASKTLAIAIREPLVLSSTSPPQGVENRDYSFTFEASGGLTPYTWTVSNGSLPPGLSLDSSGVVSGKPSGGGYFYFSIRVEDSATRIAHTSASIFVLEALKVETSSLPEINVGWHCELELHAQGGVPPYHWSLAAGSGPLPEGLTLANTATGWWGWVAGVPTNSGVFPIVLQVSDSLVPSQTATKELVLTVGNQLYFRGDYLPVAVVGRAYREGIRTYGGTPPYTWTIMSGALPAGLAFDSSTGEFVGTPQESAQYVTFGIEVKDASLPMQIASGNMVLNINPPVEFDPTPLYDAIRSEIYRGEPVTARWGKPPYTLRSLAGALPPGLSLASSTSEWGGFRITGTATTLGQYQVTYEVSDSSSPPTTANKEFSIRVVALLNVLTNSLPDGWVGEPYSAQLTAEGGVPPYTWQAFRLDPGLSLDESTGMIAGTPRYVPGVSTEFRVQDKSYPPQIAIKHFMPPIAERLVISSKLPPGRPNVPYQVKVGLKGGRAPYVWTVTSGSLPEGLSFDAATWLIQGTPIAEGTSSFTLQVTDTGPPVQTVSKALSLTIASDLGRNDSPATATPISNGTFRASISPYADPVAGPANPDHDYYQLTALPGAFVTIETTADRFVPESFLDTVIEIVDAAGNRFTSCRTPQFPSANYDQICMNDDIDLGIIQDSHLEIRVPGEGTTPVTLFVDVYSFDGNARPDYVYDLMVSGAN